MTFISWVVFLPLLFGAVCTLVPTTYEADLVASFTAQFVLIEFLLLLFWLAVRRRLLALGTLMLIVTNMIYLGAYRAQIGSLSEVDSTQSPTEREKLGLVRVYHINASRRAGLEDLWLDFEKYQPDIIHLTEPAAIWPNKPQLFTPADEASERSGGPWVLFSIAYWAQRSSSDPQELVGDSMLASRWPMTEFDKGENSWESKAVIAGRVSSPRGDFVAIALHPHSPRSKLRWEMGNDIVRCAIRVADRARAQSLPVLFVTDLNSTPTGLRSRLLGKAGYRRAKPMLRLEGTWPTREVVSGRYQQLLGYWPMQIAIDDVLIDSHFQTKAWTRSNSFQSDHWAIIADFGFFPQ